MKVLASTLLILWTSVCAASICPKPWVCEEMKLNVPYTSTVAGLTPVIVSAPVRIRAGYFPEQGSFKGNIIYYQGLGDSMLNHRELFEKLSKAGHRIIAFDYMGQGGSTGTMNRTRMENIPWIGKRVWRRFADVSRNPDVTIIGWSTGGLAAYMQAAKGGVKAVVLIAPGNTANLVVGEGLTQWPLNNITLRTLTTDIYSAENPSPHVDPIRPHSPLMVPAFSASLIATSVISRHTKMPNHIKGLVLLSGSKDTYVDGPAANQVFAKTAPKFRRITYAGALHEIHNERESIREKAHRDIMAFLEE